MIRENGQSGNRLATTPDGPAVVKPVGTWPRCVVQGLPRAFRTVRFTRSIKAVFNLPEKPNPCKPAVRASSVPSRITWVTRTSLRQRSAFFHLAVDQARRHLPSAYMPPAATHLEPMAEVSRQRIEVEVKPVTGKEREAVRGQALSESVDEPMCHVLGAGPSSSTGRILVRGSIAIHSQRMC